MKKRIVEHIKKEHNDTKILLRSIPSIVVSLFVVSVICMNLLANKTLFQNSWIALDGGILISWLSFMCMDIITKYFGPKASNKIAILASAINLLTCFIFFVASIIPSNANDYSALNSILGGSWFILLGSTVAFLVSAIVNNFINRTVNKLFYTNPDGKCAFIMSSYVSTFIGQFIDNFVFSIIVFVIFAPIFWNGFCWSMLQCTMCALTGATAEVIMEILFLQFGYRIVTNWKKNNIGSEYISRLKEEK